MMTSSTADDRVVARRYRLLRILGRGGMGVVWQARDKLLGRDVAVKEVLLPPELTDKERQVLCRRTLREARSAARISHPNVITVFDVVEEDGRPWIIMELIRARSLAQVIEEEGPLSPGRTARIGREVLTALRVAHEAGVLHRDVKPSNVLIVPHGRVVLTDFGIATLEGDPSITASGAILGSPAYVAPERAAGQPAEPKSDLWALGATLYTAVEGRPPHHRGGSVPTLMAVLNEDPDPPRRAGPLWPVLQGLLRRDPAERLDASGADLMLGRIATVPERRPLVSYRPPRSPGGPVMAPTRTGEPAEEAPRLPSEAPAEPATAKAVEDEQHTDETVPPRPGAWRRLPAAALLPLIAAAAALLVWAVFTVADRDRGSPSQARSPSVGPSASPAASPPAGGAPQPGTGTAGTSQPPGNAGGGSTAVAQPNPGRPAGRGAAAAIPAGFHRYRDPSGFSLAVPNGWRKEVRQGHVVYFLEPNGPRFMLIDQEVDPPQDMLASSQEQERNRRDGYRDYQRVRLERISYRRLNAADWEFTYSGSQQRLHVLIRSVLPTPKRSYGIYWSTPETQWARSLSYFRVFSDTFQPAPG